MSNPNHHEPIPADNPVQPLKDGENPSGKTTCGHCGLSWDADKDPAPAGRCHFEYFHKHPEAAYDGLIETVKLIPISKVWKKFPDIQKHFDAGDGYDFSWGDNNRSLIDTDTLRDELDERIDTIEASEMDPEVTVDENELPIISEERFQEFSNWLNGLPQNVYIDLEN